jgi:hypothetical protein
LFAAQSRDFSEEVQLFSKLARDVQGHHHAGGAASAQRLPGCSTMTHGVRDQT